MANTMIIQIVAGVLCVIGIGFMIQRRRTRAK